MYRVLPVEFFRWCVNSPLATWVGGTVWGVVFLQTIHVIGLALFLGGITMIDLTVLGIGMKQQGKALARDIAPWWLTGLALMLVSGWFMFMGSAISYSTSDVFAIKMLLLSAGIAVQLLIHYVPGMHDGTVHGRVAACISLLIWWGVAYSGRAIAFPELFG